MRGQLMMWMVVAMVGGCAGAAGRGAHGPAAAAATCGGQVCEANCYCADSSGTAIDGSAANADSAQCMTLPDECAASASCDCLASEGVAFSACEFDQGQLVVLVASP